MRLISVIFAVFSLSAPAQVYVSGLGGFAALSNAASTGASPPIASNYNSRVGPAFSLSVGYHLNDWISLQARYIWNRNRIVTTTVSEAGFQQTDESSHQHAVAGEVLLYFRPRDSWVRPYLSIGPAWVGFPRVDKLGFPVAVGADLRLRRGWSIRYTYSETMSGNPYAAALSPPVHSMLMNFQNLFGFTRTF